MSKICIYAYQDLHLVSIKCKSKTFAYGVRAYTCAHFAYVSKFAYTQINTHVSKSVHGTGLRKLIFDKVPVLDK